MYYQDNIKMFSFNDWDIDVDNQSLEKDTEKTICPVQIGEVVHHDGSSDPVYENIYMDILEDLLNNKQDYEIHTQRGSVPQLYIMSHGRILDHNYQIYMIRNSLHEILNGTDKSVLCRAMDEIGDGFAMKDNRNVRTIRDSFTKETGMVFELGFVKSLIMEHVTADYSEERAGDGLYDMLCLMPYDEFREMIQDVNYYKWNGKYEHERTNALVRRFSASPQKYAETVKDVLYMRALQGKLRELQKRK